MWVFLLDNLRLVDVSLCCVNSWSLLKFPGSSCFDFVTFRKSLSSVDKVLRGREKERDGFQHDS